MEAAVLGSFGGHQIKDAGWSGQNIISSSYCPSAVNQVSKGNEYPVKMESTNFDRIAGSALCNTDHLECMKRLPAGRLRISLTHLTGYSTGLSVQETVKVTGSLESSNSIAITGNARELKEHIGSQQLFAIVNKLADPPEVRYHEWVNQSHEIIADRDIELDIPTPDYSSPSDEEGEESVDTVTHKTSGSAVVKASCVDCNATVEQKQISNTDFGIVSHSKAVNDTSHYELLPKRLLRKGSIKRTRKKGKPSADAVSLSEPEDMDISRREKNDETYANGGRTLQNNGISYSLDTEDTTPNVLSTGDNLASRMVEKQLASDSRRKRYVKCIQFICKVSSVTIYIIIRKMHMMQLMLFSVRLN